MGRLFVLTAVCFLFCSNVFAQSTEGDMGFLATLWNGINSDKQEQPIQNVVIPKVPEEASFAGERVPLEYFDVRESLQRELLIINYWHEAFLILYSCREDTRK